VITPTQRIVAALHRDHPHIPVIGFPRGIGAYFPRYVAATGVDAISLDAGVTLDFAKALQQNGPVQGNLDPKILVAGGAALDEGVTAILDALRPGPFIFNLGHGVLPETPIEHVARLAELIRGA
jgi:uroporphyrinogen decarboxylase